MFSFMRNLFGNSDGSQNKRGFKSGRSPKGRRLSMESLEDRSLLSVGPFDFGAIQDQYSDLNLSANMGDYNIIEVGAANPDNASSFDFSEAGLRAAIDRAGNTTANDLIVVRTTVTQNTITLAGSQLTVNIDARTRGSVTIVTLGETPLVLDGNDQTRVIDIAAGSQVSLGGLEIVNGRAERVVGMPFVDGSGGGIRNAGTLVADRLTLSGHKGNDDGGAIFNSSVITISNSVITDSYGQGGGGLANEASGTATVLNCVISDNTSNTAKIYASGGGIVNSGKLTVIGTTISGNTAASGGGIYSGGNLVVSSSVITGNTATSPFTGSNFGGGIYYIGTKSGDTALITDSIISGNQAEYGGGISNSRVMLISGCTITDNSASFSGGGVGSSWETTIVNSAITGNHSDRNGGGISATGTSGSSTHRGMVKMFNSLVADNTATENGGGIWFYGYSGQFFLTNTTIAGNKAQTGGGVYSWYHTSTNNLKFHNTIISGNYATDASGIYLGGGECLLVHTLFGDNVGPGQQHVGGVLAQQNTFLTPAGFVEAPVFDADGNLTNADSMDLRLNPTSYAVNNGSNLLAIDHLGNPLAYDLDGNARIFGDTVDIGAYESQTSVTVRPDLIPSNLFADWTKPLIVTSHRIGNDPLVEDDSSVLYTTDTIYAHYAYANDSQGPTSTAFFSTIVLSGGDLAFPRLYPAYSFEGELKYGYDICIPNVNLGELAPGTYTLTLVVDYDNTVDESNENNNVFSKTFTVLGVPSAPTGLTTEVLGTNGVKLTWDDAPYADSYVLQRRAVGSDSWTEIHAGSATAFTDTALPLETATSFEYRVQAVNPGGTSDWSSVETATIFLSAPTAVIQIDWASATEIVLSWTSATAPGLYYTVERSEAGADRWTVVGEDRSGNTEISFTDARPDHRIGYDYRIVSHVIGDTAVSEIASVQPHLPDIAFNVREGWYAPIVLSRANGEIVDNLEYYSNERLAFRFDVRNLGAEYQGSVSLKMYCDGQWKVMTSVNFGPESQGYYNVFAAVNTPGLHTVTFVLDEEGLVEELNKENNTYTFTVNVLGVPGVPEPVDLELRDATTVGVSWATVEYATHYRLLRRVEGGNDNQWTEVYLGSDTSYLDDLSAYAPGTGFEYMLYAFNEGGGTGWSKLSSIALPMAAPEAPANLEASVRSSKQIVLSWNASKNAESYQLERYNNGVWTTIYSGNATTFSNAGLSANTTYQYRVRAVDATGTSDYSQTISATTQKNKTAAAPTELSVTASNADSLTIAWKDNSSDETGFTIRWSSDGKNWSTATVAANVKTYRIASLNAGETYSVQVMAKNNFGDSAWSNTATGQTQVPQPPGMPTQLNVTAVSHTSAELSWTAPTTSDATIIERATSEGGPWMTVATVATSSGGNVVWTDDGLSADTTYFYRLKASNVAGESGWTTTVSATTPAPPLEPTAPTNLQKKSSTGNSLTISWTDTASNETGFLIEYTQDGGKTWKTMTVSANATQATISGLKKNNTYTIRVAAFSEGRLSDYCSELTLKL